MRGKPALSAEASSDGSTRTTGRVPVTASTAASAKRAQFQRWASNGRASAGDLRLLQGGHELEEAIARVFRLLVGVGVAADLSPFEIDQPALAGQRDARLGAVHHLHGVHQPSPQRKGVGHEGALTVQQPAPEPGGAQPEAALGQRDVHHLLRHWRQRECQPHGADFGGLLDLAHGAERAHPLKDATSPGEWPKPSPGTKGAGGEV